MGEGSEGHRKWPLVDWKTICTPKAVGGLGLRDPLDSNKVMSSKYGGDGSTTKKNHGPNSGT